MLRKVALWCLDALQLVLARVFEGEARPGD
jgi:hypothetical protein